MKAGADLRGTGGAWSLGSPACFRWEGTAIPRELDQGTPVSKAIGRAASPPEGAPAGFATLLPGLDSVGFHTGIEAIYVSWHRRSAGQSQESLFQGQVSVLILLPQ